MADWTMKVKIGNNYSETSYIPSSVSQGSLVIPLLFLMFMDELPNYMISEIKLFADDIKLFVRPLSKEAERWI